MQLYVCQVLIKQIEILNYGCLGHLTGDKEHLFKDNVSPRNKDIKSLVTLKKRKKRQMKNQLSQGAGDSKASI